MSIRSTLCSNTPVRSVKIPGITLDRLARICIEAEMDIVEYCLVQDEKSPHFGRYVVPGRFINFLVTSFIEKLAAGDSESPIKKAHYISTSYKTTREEPIFTDEDLVFYLQVNSEETISSGELKQFVCKFEIKRNTDDVLVFAGVITCFERN
jgi:hypothetical protein